MCGSDGQTYPNKCKMLAEACKSQQQVPQHGGLVVIAEEQCSESKYITCTSSIDKLVILII